jgi:hypothetical protein
MPVAPAATLDGEGVSAASRHRGGFSISGGECTFDMVPEACNVREPEQSPAATANFVM